jgi:hypothetical protein
MKVKADKREDIVLVASGIQIIQFFFFHVLFIDDIYKLTSLYLNYLEPLTFEKADWLIIPTNTCFVITPKFNVLLFPIKDQYYNADRMRKRQCIVPPSVL